MFFGSSLVIYILFIHLAREWPKVMEKWELMEREMRQFGYPPKTAFKFKILTSIVMVLAISTCNIKIIFIELNLINNKLICLNS